MEILIILQYLCIKMKKSMFYKNKLPNYGVFDEKRIFQKGKKNNVIKFKRYNIGLLICEDIWYGDLPTYFKKKERIY